MFFNVCLELSNMVKLMPVVFGAGDENAVLGSIKNQLGFSERPTAARVIRFLSLKLNFYHFNIQAKS